MLDEMVTLCFASTVTTVPMTTKAGTEQCGDCTGDGDKTVKLHVNRKYWPTEVDKRQMNRSGYFALSSLPYGDAYRC